MRKALLVGINYFGTSSALNGCINDIKNIQLFLKNSRNYTDFVILTDDNPKAMPTKDNILKELRNLVKDAKIGDELWFHYSGHGLLITDKNNDEETGQDSALAPVDYIKNGFIIDDTIRSILVVPDGVRVYVILDACHSGTGCDLRYKIEDFSYLKKKGKTPTKYLSNDWILKQTTTQLKNYEKSNGDLFMISGCKDEQTSADAYEEGNYTGALTYCFLKTIKNNYGNCKWKILLKDLNGLLKVKGYTQRPVLTMGKQVNTNEMMFPIDKKETKLDKILRNIKIEDLL